MRYIKFKRFGFLIWPDVDTDYPASNITHSEMAKKVEDYPVSAGFVTLSPTIVCSGQSHSLGIGSQEGDSEELRRRLHADRGH